jgi:4-amino-4-deoxy-L-arabinose transferase-like glycosyltransferase
MKRLIQQRDHKVILLAIFLFSILSRVAAALYFGQDVTPLPGTHDQISYHTLALRVLQGHGFTFGQNWWPVTQAGSPTAHWSYLYTLFLTAVYAVLGVQPLVARVLQALIVAILQPYLTWQIGRSLFGARVGLAAAALSAVYIYFIYYAAVLMTEAFYMVAVLAVLWLLLRLAQVEPQKVRGVAIWLGLALAAAVLLRQLFLLLFPFLLLWAVWARYRRYRTLPWRPLLLTALIVAGFILPFTLYNYTRFDRFVLLNTNAGYAFFWANHPIYGTHFEPILPAEMGSYQDLIPDELRALDEAALEQALMQRGVGFVLQDPLRYALLSVSRIPAYFMFWPSSSSGTVSNLSRVLSFGLFLPFMLYGLWLGVRQSRPQRQAEGGRFARLAAPDVLLYLFVLLYTAIHLLSWALVRYRLPVDSVLLVFAGAALVTLAQRLFASRRVRLAADEALLGPEKG